MSESAWASSPSARAKVTADGPIAASACGEQPIRELLELPLDEVRRRLNVPEARTYHKVLEIWRSEGIDPHAFLAAEDA